MLFLIYIVKNNYTGKLVGVTSMIETSTADKPTKVSKANVPKSEKQQLVAGVFASKSAAEAAMGKVHDQRKQG
jgi:hypothetical protein